ncbi:outer membrane beta-barrel protein [Croceibacterium sp. TMG7-5b_MA50]|uniref:outer membrane protein n=1 Tax=Croceibacterium sp. TMG7-5b_MA50 TaxID=3121290 RepID=UPI0032213B5E
MKAFLTALTVGTAVIAAPAMAQSTTTTWDGPYVGIQGGYAITEADSGETLVFDGNGDENFTDTVRTAAGANAFSPGFCDGNANSGVAANGCEDDQDSWLAGVRAGYDRQVGPVVLGVVADYTQSKLRNYVSGFSTTPASYTFTRTVRNQASLRARAGVTSGDGLLYATGGLAWARVQNRFTTTNTANSFTPNNDEEGAWGYVLGGGYEHKLTDNVSLGLEYQWRNLKADDFQVAVGRGSAPATNPFLIGGAGGTDIERLNGRFKTHGLTANVNFRF